MHSLEPEFRALRDQGVLDEAAAARAIALDRGAVMSLHLELRAVLYAGVLLVTVGVGTLLARHLDRIGPLSIVLGLAAAALACAVPAMRARGNGRSLTTAADYLLLLGALLGAADLAYAESRYALLGAAWTWHFAIVAVATAAIAYLFGSKPVLAAALAALAAWFGVGGSFADPLRLIPGSTDFGGRALSCALLIAAWKVADARARPTTTFGEVFDHYAANLAFCGALAWCMDTPWSFAGLPILAVLSALSIRHGLVAGRESFVVYGVGYAALGACFAVVPHLPGITLPLVFALVVVCGAATALWQLRRRMKEGRS